MAMATQRPGPGDPSISATLCCVGAGIALFGLYVLSEIYVGFGLGLSLLIVGLSLAASALSVLVSWYSHAVVQWVRPRVPGTETGASSRPF